MSEEEDGASVSGSVAAEAEKEEELLPWAEFNKFYTYVKAKNDRNFLAKCKSCPNKEVSCAFSSRNNLRSHLIRVHNWTEEKLNAELKVTPRRKRSGGDDLAEGEEKATPFKKRVTQKDLNRAIDEFVICTRQAHRVVDSEHFRKLALLGLPRELKVPCRQTFRKNMDEHIKVMTENLKKKFKDVEHVAACADGWSKFRRGFLGVVATWLDPETMERQFAGLALQRLRGRHTYDKLAAELIKVFECYQLWPSASNNNNCPKKVSKVTTDSAANFLKAFKVFSAAQLNDFPDLDEILENESGSECEENDNAEDCDDPGSGNVNLVDLNNVLEAASLEGMTLPDHQRCGAHIINLMGTKDAEAAREENATYKRQFDATEAKLKEYWRRQNKSDLVADVIKEGLGVKLEVPGETRWNSRFDAKKQIVDLIDNNLEKFNETLEKAGLPELTNSDIKFLTEYVHVMHPVAFALDILQRDKSSYLGYLLPTVHAMQKKIIERKKIDGKPLKYCGILAETLLDAIEKPRRFEAYLAKQELYIAAALIPCFKLDWIEDPDKRLEVRQAILREMHRLDRESQVSDAAAAASATPGSRHVAVVTEDEERVDDPDSPGNDTTAEEDFFGFVRSPPTMPSSEKGPETPEEELQRYITRVDRSWTIKDCYGTRGQGQKREFPRLYRLFIKYNTALPSSALVERFFSRAGLSFQAIRNALGDETLQQEVLLSINQQFW